MTAQIIAFPSARLPKVTSAQKRATRGLLLSDQQAALLARMNRGEVITDIGQIDARTRRLLKRWLDKGYVFRGVDYTFPKEKTCWIGAGYDAEECPLPLNYKFREV